VHVVEEPAAELVGRAAAGRAGVDEAEEAAEVELADVVIGGDAAQVQESLAVPLTLDRFCTAL